MKKLSLVLVLVMLFSMFSFAAAEEPTELVITVSDDNTAQYEENSVVIKALEEKLNVKLTFNRIISDDYSSKQTLALTSMEMGDLWQWKGTTDEMNEYGDLGAFVNLKDYEDKMPNMFAMYEKYAEEAEPFYSKDTGAMYGAFRIYDFPYANEDIMIRKDIVEKVGYTLDDIKTIDDLTEVLYAMKEAYPDSTPLQGRCAHSAGRTLGAPRLGFAAGGAEQGKTAVSAMRSRRFFECIAAWYGDKRDTTAGWGARYGGWLDSVGAHGVKYRRMHGASVPHTAAAALALKGEENGESAERGRSILHKRIYHTDP